MNAPLGHRGAADLLARCLNGKGARPGMPVTGSLKRPRKLGQINPESEGELRRFVHLLWLFFPTLVCKALDSSVPSAFSHCISVGLLLEGFP